MKKILRYFFLALIAVDNGYQACIMAPTEVLAQQHYENFKKRFAAFPINVEMLSRFRTPKQQAQILKKLESGEIDIIDGAKHMVLAAPDDDSFLVGQVKEVLTTECQSFFIHRS